MKFSLAIVALLGLTSAIKIVEEPAAAAPAPKADAEAPAGEKPESNAAPAATDPEAVAAAAPAAPLTKAKGIVDDALKTSDQKSEEDALKAGTPIDVKNAPEAVESPVKIEKPEELSDAEKMRNHVVRIATVGQEAIKVADMGVADV